MDKDTLIRNLNRRYCSKREMLSRIPLGVQPDELWQELLKSRQVKSVTLPLYSAGGSRYWYVTTDAMIAASEKIVETLYTDGSEIDPFTEPTPVVSLEEAFFTSYVEGAQITMQAAMDFLASGQPPRDIEEQMIANNRMAGKYAAENLYRGIDSECLCGLAYLLTDGMDSGGQDYRTENNADHTSVDGECFSFPSPIMIPGYVDAFCGFLASPQVHPLIKAGVAQGYMLLLRPFPEGNERLGRILSGMILLRAGYMFFGDISLSALIARRSYAYYEATANILREENGGDLTYFLEFFMDLLSRAVDERALRQQRREKQNLQTEQDMARTALTAPAIPPPVSLPDEPFDDPPEQPELPPAAVKSPDADANASAVVQSEASERPSKESMDRIQDLLLACGDGTNERLKACAELLMRFMHEGKYTFTQAAFCESCGFDTKQAARMMYMLREKSIIESSGTWNGRYMIYRFCTNPATSQQPEKGIPDDAEISDEEDLLDGFFTVSAQEPGDISNGLQHMQKEINTEHIREMLLQCSDSNGFKTRACAELLLGYLDSGRCTFARSDIAAGCNLQTKQADNVILYFRKKGIMEIDGSTDDKKHTLYRFKTPPLPIMYANDATDSAGNAEGSNVFDGIFTCPVRELASEAKEKSKEQIRELLVACTASPGKNLKVCAKHLLGFIDQEKYMFSQADIAKCCNLNSNQLKRVLHQMKEKGIVKSCNTWEGRYMLYRFNTGIQSSFPVREEGTVPECPKAGADQTAPRSAHAVPALTIQDYASDVIDSIKELRDSGHYKKDCRLGEIMLSCLSKGIVTAQDYADYGDARKMDEDFALPIRMGIVEKVRSGVFRIKRERAYGLPTIGYLQRAVLSGFYRCFRQEWFTKKMALTELKMSRTRIGDALHQFSVLRLIEHKGNGVFHYRLLVNPDNAPSLFDKDALAVKATPIVVAEEIGKLTVPEPLKRDGSYSDEVYDLLDKLSYSSGSMKDRRLSAALQRRLNQGVLLHSDYMDWGLSDNIWRADTEFAVQLGLIHEETKDKYILNRSLCPMPSQLKKQQKKTIAAIYEAFGDQIFSSEMFVATLKYTKSYSYASLHKLALMRVLDQRTTKDGSRYQLLVNPMDHPEFFDDAA